MVSSNKVDRSRVSTLRSKASSLTKKIIDLRLAPSHRIRLGLGLETAPPESPQFAPNELSYTTKNVPSFKDKQVTFIQQNVVITEAQNGEMDSSLGKSGQDGDKDCIIFKQTAE